MISNNCFSAYVVNTKGRMLDKNWYVVDKSDIDNTTICFVIVLIYRGSDCFPSY